MEKDKETTDVQATQSFIQQVRNLAMSCLLAQDTVYYDVYAGVTIEVSSTLYVSHVTFIHASRNFKLLPTKTRSKSSQAIGRDSIK